MSWPLNPMTKDGLRTEGKGKTVHKGIVNTSEVKEKNRLAFTQ